jgi:DNA-binding transcriptional ArsR family regulator
MDPLDEPKAALRVLIQLSIHSEGLNVTALYGEMSERFGVGRPATNSSYKALLDAGLVEVTDRKVRKRRLKMIRLTDRGRRISTKIRGILCILQEPIVANLHLADNH